MMKGLYIYHDMSQKENMAAIGVLKKVFSQHKLFDSIADEGCNLVNLQFKCSKNRLVRVFSYLFSNNTFDLSWLKNKKYDFVYIRRIIPNSRSAIKLLRLLREQNPSCKIVYEIPTYPYDAEHRSLTSKVVLFIDYIWRKYLYKYIDRFATLTDDKKIFNCPTLKIANGVDCASIPVCAKTEFDSNKINLIAVAQFSFWHGYERVIEGLHNYPKDNVVLHLVGGDSPELKKYKLLVEKYGLEKQVVFHGALYGDKLTKIFDESDIALCSLGAHRAQIYVASFLKSREYLCRGLPMVSSTKIDIVPDDFNYMLRVPEDDSAIDIASIVSFANKIYNGNRENVADEIRFFAENNCSMSKSMSTVIEFFKS